MHHDCNPFSNQSYLYPEQPTHYIYYMITFKHLQQMNSVTLQKPVKKKKSVKTEITRFVCFSI